MVRLRDKTHALGHIFLGRNSIIFFEYGVKMLSTDKPRFFGDSVDFFMGITFHQKDCLLHSDPSHEFCIGFSDILME